MKMVGAILGRLYGLSGLSIHPEFQLALLREATQVEQADQFHDPAPPRVT